VSVVPPGYAKLAYEPAIFTGHSQAERRADVAAAFRGDAAAIAPAAEKYGAQSLVLARREGLWGLVDVPAATLELDALSTVAAENGYDMVDLLPGARLRLPLPEGRHRLEIRLNGGPGSLTRGEGSLAVTAVGPGGTRDLGRLVVPGTGIAWFVATVEVDLAADETLVLDAVSQARIQGIRGFAALDAPPPGWAVAVDTPEAIVLERR
jgi:hypothetical protein